jgi:hypothetical protein
VYDKAFKVVTLEPNLIEYHNAAVAWSKANYPDSAFKILNTLSKALNYFNLVVSDSNFLPLHNDKRWHQLLIYYNENKKKQEQQFKQIRDILDVVRIEDQSHRVKLNEMMKTHNARSEEIKNQWRIILKKDSINIVKVKAILDKEGWLGPEEIGLYGNQTLFLVIQHSDLKTQEKYLPMLRNAVEYKKASAIDLALLEDRIAVRKGNKQIYGSQVGGEPGHYFVFPIEDPDNLDHRRINIGLQPISNYLLSWGIKWDLQKYKDTIMKMQGLRYGQSNRN